MICASCWVILPNWLRIEALKQCAINAEFWVRKGVALDVQRGRPEAEDCFRRAVELAPKSAPTWYAYAYHLQAFPNRRDEVRKALDTCLALDPYYPRQTFCASVSWSPAR